MMKAEDEDVLQKWAYQWGRVMAGERWQRRDEHLLRNDDQLQRPRLIAFA
jgi:hypothetical protein